MTVTVCPAMVSVPLRAVPVLAAMASVTVPFPVPLVPDGIVMNTELLTAVQPQVVGAVTVTVDAPPDAAAVIVVVESA